MVIEGDRAVRHALRMALELEHDLAVVGEADGVATALALTRAIQPDVILTELLADEPGSQTLTASLLRAAPGSAVIILSHLDELARRREAAAQGAASFVGKHEPYPALLAAIRLSAGRAC